MFFNFNEKPPEIIQDRFGAWWVKFDRLGPGAMTGPLISYEACLQYLPDGDSRKNPSEMPIVSTIEIPMPKFRVGQEVETLDGLYSDRVEFVYFRCGAELTPQDIVKVNPGKWSYSLAGFLGLNAIYEENLRVK